MNARQARATACTAIVNLVEADFGQGVPFHWYDDDARSQADAMKVYRAMRRELARLADTANRLGHSGDLPTRTDHDEVS